VVNAGLIIGLVGKTFESGIHAILMTILRFVCLVIACLGAGFAASADVSRVQVVGNGEPTRITVWADSEQEGRAFLAESGNARSLVLPVDGPVTPAVGDGGGGVATWALSEGTLSFALERPLMVARTLSLPPAGNEPSYRVIVDLQTVSAARFSSVAKKDMRKLASYQAKKRKEELAIELASMRPDAPLPASQRVANQSYTVVIDAGHGGKDPGAMAITGGVEKDITLRAALALKNILQADPRYTVRLTRDTDVYVDHEVRVSMARDWGADLFISLHADAAASRDVAGASVYTISASGERRIDKEANRNNWRIPLEDGAPQRVSGILEDLVKRETKTHSSEFAEMLLPELEKSGPVLRNTHREAGFYVLLAPDVPAVLLEMGFVTNRADAKRLQSDRDLRNAMSAVKRGIDRFFDKQDILLAGQG
jgi:N-acetylmuramoyl-L-alanine amidase|tara:strand:- start:148649 stop:149923 length:1275 start_codon:yes stop_codon:yes gene_type:complete